MSYACTCSHNLLEKTVLRPIADKASMLAQGFTPSEVRSLPRERTSNLICIAREAERGEKLPMCIKSYSIKLDSLPRAKVPRDPTKNAGNLFQQALASDKDKKIC